jgi:hypothetical protein
MAEPLYIPRGTDPLSSIQKVEQIGALREGRELQRAQFEAGQETREFEKKLILEDRAHKKSQEDLKKDMALFKYYKESGASKESLATIFNSRIKRHFDGEIDDLDPRGREEELAERLVTLNDK